MKTSILGITAALFLCVGCNQHTSEAPPDEAEPDGKKEPAGAPTDALAGPSETPDGLAGLKLTKEQAAKINLWLREQGGQVDPSKLAAFVQSVLRDDQQADFRKIIEAGGG